MSIAIIGLVHIIGTLGTQIVAHGGLSLGIAKGFGVCLAQWSIAHTGTAAAVAAAAGAAGYGIKKAASSNDNENE